MSFSDCTKGIFFDKPEGFNWFVGFHQDLSISIKEKLEVSGFSKFLFVSASITRSMNNFGNKIRNKMACSAGVVKKEARAKGAWVKSLAN